MSNNADNDIELSDQIVADLFGAQSEPPDEQPVNAQTMPAPPSTSPEWRLPNESPAWLATLEERWIASLDKMLKLQEKSFIIAIKEITEASDKRWSKVVDGIFDRFASKIAANTSAAEHTHQPPDKGTE